MQQITIVIPTLNEAAHIATLLHRIAAAQHHASHICTTQTIVVDAQSTDATPQIAQQMGATLIHAPQQGRAAQLNLGAHAATGNILYFVHADTLPPLSFITDILAQLQLGHQAGCYRFRFDSDKWLLKINNFFTRFDFDFCRGGDQTLFITTQLFKKIGGFDEYYCIMEEYDLMRRTAPHTKFAIIPKYVLVSARKYEKNSYFKVMYANFIAFRMFKKGHLPQQIKAIYAQNIYTERY
jgi:rSAM/selenodomain-associated transferase 2